MAESQRLLDFWLGPPGAGEPLACLATSYTFDTDFFRDECLARFLGMRSAAAEEAVGTLAQISELEERLSDVTATAIVDRSTSIDARNLRWDLLPVVFEAGLLHAKTALLVWEKTCRVIIGSANLTAAGYRYQREIAVALDLEPGTPISRTFWSEYFDELDHILEVVPDDLTSPGPKARARSVVNLARSRLDDVPPPASTTGARVALIPSRPGESALERLTSFLPGKKPRWLTAMSPYWDSDDAGRADAVRALTGMLASTGTASAALLVPLQATDDGQLVSAPRGLPKRGIRPGVDISLYGVTDLNDSERRRLHAKALVLESEEWTTLMIGSSNMTAAGLGLSPNRGHIELNIAYSAKNDTKLAKMLLRVLPSYVDLDLDEDSFLGSPDDGEEEPTRPVLPAGFLAATLTRSEGTWVLHLGLDPAKLPTTWRIRDPAHALNLLDHGSFDGSSEVQVAITTSELLPQALVVTWTTSEGLQAHADWVINVSDPSQLPLDERLRAIPIDLIVQALAQRGVAPGLAIERLLDRLSRLDEPEESDIGYSPLDPLQRYDDSRALLRRMAVYGRALDQLSHHLSRPVPTASALGWRLSGLISPARLAEGWADQCAEGELPPELAHFLFAELQLLVARIDWPALTTGLDPDVVSAALNDMHLKWKEAHDRLPPLDSTTLLAQYLTESRM